MAEKRRELHGNKAKANPDGKTDPLFISNTVTMSERDNNGTPVVEDSDVAYARNFVIENKK